MRKTCHQFLEELKWNSVPHLLRPSHTHMRVCVEDSRPRGCWLTDSRGRWAPAARSGSEGRRRLGPDTGLHCSRGQYPGSPGLATRPLDSGLWLCGWWRAVWVTCWLWDIPRPTELVRGALDTIYTIIIPHCVSQHNTLTPCADEVRIRSTINDFKR